MDVKEFCKLLTVHKDTRISSSSMKNDEKLPFEVTERVERIEETFAKNLKTKIYKRRWLQLGLFFVYAAANTSQWVQFTIVTNIICRYYSVSASSVDWTSIIFYLAYVILLFPATYVMDRVGLRWSCLIGATGTSIGAWIKVFAVSPDRFVLLFVGQTIVASSQIFVLNGPPRLAATWFGSKEVATATAIGCSGGLVGVSLLFLITPIIVKNHERIDDIGEELLILSLAVAIVSTLVNIALFLIFDDGPDLAPSEARALQILNRRVGSKEFRSRLGRTLRNKSFLMLWNAYGINLGSFNAISTLMNPLFLLHFKNGEADAGKLGFLFSFLGNIGAIVFGMILDKTKKFKALNILIYSLTLFGEILFAVGLIMEIKWLVFLSISVTGISTISHGTIGLELSAEVTYPESEELPSALLNMAQQIYGIILSLIVGGLLRNYGDKTALLCLTAILTLGLVMTLFIKNELKRQNVREVELINCNNPVALLKLTESADKIGNEMIIPRHDV